MAAELPALQSWWVRFPSIFLAEVRAAREKGFRPRLARWEADGDSGPERLIMRGRIRVKAARLGEAERWHGFTMEVAYPPNYPFDKLDVRPVEPPIRRRRHQLRRSGELCYMQEEMEGWVLGYGIERAIEGAEQWFRGEITGHFEDELPAAELLAYFEEVTSYIRSLLLPRHIIWERPPEPSGLLELEWDGQMAGVAVVGIHRTMKGSPLADVRYTNDRIWRSIRGSRRFKTIPGLWFSLESEPPPFSDLAGLEEILSNYAGIPSSQFQNLVVRVLDSSRRRGGWLPVGLNYPVRRQMGHPVEREWLFCTLEWPELPKRTAKGQTFRKLFWRQVTVKGVSSYSVSPSDLIRRRGQLYPHEGIETAHVVVVGTGALGSTVARSLTAAGVDRVTLVEPDILKPGNVMRHEARMPDVGKMKVTAMRQILHETNPYVDVDTVYGTRTNDRSFEQAILNQTDPPTLIIATVAVRAVDGQVDDVARRAAPPIPVLHAWVMAQAQVLRAFLYRPGRTACFWCNGLYARDSGAGLTNGYIVEPATPNEPFFEASCASPAFPGAGNANGLAAHIIVEMALDVLHDRLPDDQSHWIFTGNRIRDIDATFPVEPLTVARRGFGAHRECPVCSEGILDDTLSEKECEYYSEELIRVRNGS